MKSSPYLHFYKQSSHIWITPNFDKKILIKKSQPLINKGDSLYPEDAEIYEPLIVTKLKIHIKCYTFLESLPQF